MPGLFLFLKKRDSTLEVCRTISEETTKRVNYHKNGNLPLFYIEKDTRVGFYTLLSCVSCWRRKRDLNPRYGIPYYSLSRGAPSASWVFLHSRSIKNDISISIVAHNVAFVKVFLQNFCRSGINPNKGCIKKDRQLTLESISCCAEYITSQKASRRKASANL